MTYPETPDQGSGSPQDAARHGEGVVNISRRRIFRGAAGGAGVLLAVHAKTALGSHPCQSPSAMFSGGSQVRHENPPSCSGGKSPGFWKQPQHFGSWPTTYPTFKDVQVGTCSAKGESGLGTLNEYADAVTLMETPGTTLSGAGFAGTSFTGNGGTYAGSGDNVSIWFVLAFPNSFKPGGQLLRHAVATWLNANAFGAVGFPVRPEQVLAMWRAVASGGLWCPGGCLPGSTIGWDADQVKAYFEGLYDVDSLSDPKLCVSAV